MKYLDKEVIYDLSYLNKEERTELFEYLLSVDKTYEINRKWFIKCDYDFICYDFNNDVWDWEDWGDESEKSKIAIKNRSTINAKTLFAPKVNIINPTESENEKTIQEWEEHFKTQQEAIKNVFGVNVNDLIDSLNYMKEQFNSKQCTSGEQDLKCNIDFVESENFINSDFIQKPKYKFQHVESYINDNKTYNIDLTFFKEKKNGLIKIKRVPYLQNINQEVTDVALNEIKDSIIKFLEQCEK